MKMSTKKSYWAAARVSILGVFAPLILLFAGCDSAGDFASAGASTLGGSPHFRRICKKRVNIFKSTNALSYMNGLFLGCKGALFVGRIGLNMTPMGTESRVIGLPERGFS